MQPSKVATTTRSTVGIATSHAHGIRITSTRDALPVAPQQAPGKLELGLMTGGFASVSSLIAFRAHRAGRRWASGSGISPMCVAGGLGWHATGNSVIMLCAAYIKHSAPNSCGIT